MLAFSLVPLFGKDFGSNLSLSNISGSDPTEGFPDFIVDSRKGELENFPCLDCHEDQEADPTIRTLEAMHDDITLQHGNGRFWCINCHSLNNRNVLISFNSTPIDFDESYLLCGQCHFQQQKDFFGGAHGKRKESWRGVRKLTTCTECHNPHNPKIAPRKPVALPKTRTGLQRKVGSKHEKKEFWETMETH